MPTAKRQLATDPLIATIERYYVACSAGDVDGVIACCTPDVVQYMLEPSQKPVRGAEHLGRYWNKAVRVSAAEWKVEHAIAGDDEAVIEWSMSWTHAGDGNRYLVHGAEWYEFRDGLISEIRAYYRHGAPEDTGLTGFPYSTRGYTTIQRDC